MIRKVLFIQFIASSVLFLLYSHAAFAEIVDGGQFEEEESGEQLYEEERVKEYYARGYTWPPKYNPDTDGWKKIMGRRFEQVAGLPVEDMGGRYNAYLLAISSAVVIPNFTENGWGLTRAPDGLVKELKESLYMGLKSQLDEEEYTDAIDGSIRPGFIPQDELNDKALQELKPMHEEWAGVPLHGSTAYGLRVYHNESSLLMHVDKTETHVISCILHVDHDPESDPWPIVIEDFQGNTNEVTLESGDMLFYESSKCLHGRPRKFNGDWYSSLFVHYKPADWDSTYNALDSHYAVPPHWSELTPPKDGIEKIEAVSTSITEPECEDGWCALKNTVKWKGPAIPGTVISTGIKYSTSGTPATSEVNDGSHHAKNDEL